MASQVWTAAYTEIAQRITDNLPKVLWVDLWHNQVGFMDEQHPFTTPAVFLAFRSLGDPTDLGELVQQVNFQVDMYYFYETFLDTYQEAYNQSDALQYLDTMSDLYALFHGFSGNAFSEMRRVAFRPVDTGSAGNLYLQSFTGTLHDEVAKRLFDLGKTKEAVDVVEGEAPEKATENDFIIPIS